MKTEASFQDRRYIYNPKPEMLDDFWNDCVELKEKKQNNRNNKINSQMGEYGQKLKSNNQNNNFYQHTQYHPSQGRNLNKKSNIRGYRSVKFFNPKNRPNNINGSNNNFNNSSNKLNSSTEKFLVNLYNKHPSFIEEMKEKENQKIKRKNALMRCLGLYAYGLELQKSMKISKENNERQKEKEDISKCTFKPKLNKKISYLDDDKTIYEGTKNRLYQNNLKKYVNRSVDNIHKKKNNNYDSEEYTFKPELFCDSKAVERMLRKWRNQNKTISDEKENAEFILRYTKARDEYLIKRFKKMYRKDDNYDYSLLTLTRRLCNKQYRNYLNVNNTILLFGETITPTNYLHSSIADFRGLSLYNETPEQKQSKNDNYIIGLRRNLHSLDLTETGEEH